MRGEFVLDDLLLQFLIDLFEGVRGRKRLRLRESEATESLQLSRKTGGYRLDNSIQTSRPVPTASIFPSHVWFRTKMNALNIRNIQLNARSSLTNEDNQSDRYHIVRDCDQRNRRYIQPEERSLTQKQRPCDSKTSDAKKLLKVSNRVIPTGSQATGANILGYEKTGRCLLVRNVNCIKQIAQRDRLFEVKRAYRRGFCLSLLGTERSNENKTFS